MEEYEIKKVEKNNINKKIALTVLLSVAGISALALSGKAILNHINKDIALNETYDIDYGTIKFSGEYLELFETSSLRMFKTTEGYYYVVCKDSKNNYYLLDDFTWYKKYLTDGSRITLVNSEGQTISGVIDNFNKYLNDKEKDKKSYSLEELMDIQNRTNESEYTLSLSN